MKVKLDMEVLHDARMTQQRVNELVQDIGRAVEEGVSHTSEVEWLKADIVSIITKLEIIKGQL